MSCGCQPSSSNCVPFNPCPPENYGGMFPSLVGPMGPPGGPGTFVPNYATLRLLDATVWPDGYIAWVLGADAINDGGTGLFVYNPTASDADNDGTIIRPANGIGRWFRLFSGPVFAKWFRAKGDGVTNDTTAIQNAINFCKATTNRTLFFTAGTYIVTLSLDCTFNASGDASFWIVGENNRTTIIKGLLTEAYPVCDFSGDTRGGISDIQVWAPTGSATCCVYSAKPTAAANYGNVFTVNRCVLSLKTGITGTIDDVALVIYNTDLSSVFNSEVYGPTACTAGGGKRAAITSKYQTTPALFDSTLVKVQNCIFNSWAGPAFEYTGGAKLVLDFCYLAITGAGYSSIFKISGIGGKSVYARSLEMENQSAAGNVNTIYFETGSYVGEISGDIESGAAGGDCMFGAPQALGSFMREYKLTVASTGNPVFRAGTLVQNVDLYTQQNTLGSVHASSYGLNIVQNSNNGGRTGLTRWSTDPASPLDQNMLFEGGPNNSEASLTTKPFAGSSDTRLRVARNSTPTEWIEMVAFGAGTYGAGLNNAVGFQTVGNPNARTIVWRQSVDGGATFTELARLENTTGAWITAGVMSPASYTVANLPSGLYSSYAIAFVTDATQAQGVGGGSAPVGGGGNKRPVYTTNGGTSWLQY